MSPFRPAPMMTFLPLSPVTSDSFPKTQQSMSAAGSEAISKRRSSSLSSEGKTSFRVLKVAPVHFGAHPGDHQDDWHEVAVVEV
ncbi:hypothetical protein VP1G_05646 [Cytospora mali]|uniref:Uncharacterized protein n=1 Tax=Cytospora mali TaxID=578113 RepID=A0A194V346_CYTMA|nr:hypothetical protein VP1G_05646 [Valsa mali var. pyri (nom. inval.)]